MRISVNFGLLIILLVCAHTSYSGTYDLSADYSRLDSYPLQKTQFGISYVGSSSEDIENVYELLKARNTRNNDKRLRGTWVGWDAVGDPIYERSDRVSELLENAGKYGAIGGANLQGPYEHPEANVYRISNQNENLWDWNLYTRHSVLYYQHLRKLVDDASHPDYPFVFGIGHEVNNDANLDTLGLGRGCVDGIAFMGNLNAFHDLVINKKDKKRGDVIQASSYFKWYKQLLDELYLTYEDRREFLITAGQPHTSSYAMGSFMKTFRDLVDDNGSKYIPDYIGSHARWNIPGDERFFEMIVGPSRELFNDDPLWMAVPLQCNEFGIYDHSTKYRKSVLGAVRLLNNFERMLKSPDIGYVNFIYNGRFEDSDGTLLHPAFHAFRFYQNMPQSRTQVSGHRPLDIHVLSSTELDSRQSALLWRDETGTGSHSVNFTFANASAQWTSAEASLYVISNEDMEASMSSSRASGDYGFEQYLVKGYPKTIHGHDKLKDYTYYDISLPQASIALLQLERLDPGKGDPSPCPDSKLNHVGPIGAKYIKTRQWTARNSAGSVDPSWGFFDTRSWTLFAGIDDVSGSAGSAIASYLSNTMVERGMAGVEFMSDIAVLRLEVDVETGDLNPDQRDESSIGAIRIDFYNGNTNQYDAAVILAGNRCPSLSKYTEDHVPWGYGGTRVEVIPQRQVMGQVYDGNEWSVNLDDQYMLLTSKPDAKDFIAGDRRVIVSAWVENIEAGLVVRIESGVPKTELHAVNM